MGTVPALGAVLASLLILGAEYLPAGLWKGALIWEQGTRLALVCLVWSVAAAFPAKAGSGTRLHSGVLAMAWCLPALAAALALETASVGEWPLGILLVGTLAVGFSAAAGASRFAAVYLALILGVGLGLPVLAAVAGWGAGAEPAWLQAVARLSPHAWLAGAAQGEHALDAWLAPYGLALLLLAGWPRGDWEQQP
ncbi:MAG: hypothetical protein ACI8QC_002991 [Planctomycetota bacterium]|jgi:hypothetical protein